ncbi:MAG TPA: murein biosynthesis integral membrane protein MurJ [Opitutus sp.]|nr:murein biosynthesis integral membrane protein MurJ [Opitutus sp.]
MSKHLKNIGLVSGLTMASRVLGLARESLTAAVFGTSELLSAFVTGITLPNIFRRLLAEGGLTAAFIPALNDELEVRQRPGAFALVNQVTSWLFAVTVVLVAVAMLLLSQDGAIRAIGRIGGAEPATIARWLDGARFAVMLFPYLILVSLAAAFSAALQTLHRFLEPALSPIWLNLSIIGLLLAALHWAHGNPPAQVLWLSAGWMAGGFLQMIVPAAALVNEGWRPRPDFRLSPPVRGMLRLMAPTVFSSSIYLFNMSVSRLVGLSLNDAAVAVLNFSQRLMELPIGVFAIAVSTVVFPLIARFAAAGDQENLAQAYRKGMRLILLVNVPAAVGLAVLAVPIIRLILQHGQFTAEATAMMRPVLIANAVGLPFLAFVSLALRAFYAQKDTVTPLRAAALSFAVNLVLSLLLMGPFSTTGLAVASTVAVVVQAAYLQGHLARRHDGLAFRHLSRDLGKIVVASAVMGTVVAAGWWARLKWLPGRSTFDVLALAMLIAGGVLVYGALAWGLRVEARDEVAAVLARMKGREKAN